MAKGDFSIHRDPTVAELAEQVASLIEGVNESDLRSTADSLFPSVVPLTSDAGEPAPFDLVRERSLPALLFEPMHLIAVVAAFAGLSLVALLGTRLDSGPRAALAATAQTKTRTPAQAASWATEPFTVEVPLATTDKMPASAPASGPSAPSPAALAHFDVDAAAVALAEAKISLSDCEADGDSVPATARATVTFSPAGHVSAVLLDQSEGAAPLPDCVAEHLRAVRVAPFFGSSVTVRTMVTFPVP
jgi:hypothetical protein